MAILIEGMEMPKDDMKNIMILADGRVFQFSGYGNPKPLGTAVPVPELHGRIGDLDELKTAFPSGEYVRTESVRATIDHMRTIIPESGEAE